MKKIISTLAVALLLVTSTFAFEMAVGFRGMIGGNVGNVDSEKDGFVSGSGLYANLNFYNGFGVQAEANFVSSTISTGSNSITFKPCEIVDIPIMFWYNSNITHNMVAGGGAGLNISAYSDRSYKTSNDSSVNLGFAMGLNFKFFFTDRFGLALGTNAVFDFMPTEKYTGPNNEVTYVFGSEDKARKAIYGTIGVEVRLF